MLGREILIAVSGGIAAYKTAHLVSRLAQAGAGVSVIMTRAATKLVGPKTFEALSGRPVVTDEWASGAHPHIMIARRAEADVRGAGDGERPGQGRARPGR